MEWGPKAPTVMLLEWLFDEVMRLELFPVKDEVVNETFEMWELRYWKALLQNHAKDNSVTDQGVTGLAKKAGVNRSTIYNKYRSLGLQVELMEALKEKRTK